MAGRFVGPTYRRVCESFAENAENRQRQLCGLAKKPKADGPPPQTCLRGFSGLIPAAYPLCGGGRQIWQLAAPQGGGELIFMAKPPPAFLPPAVFLQCFSAGGFFLPLAFFLFFMYNGGWREIAFPKCARPLVSPYFGRLVERGGARQKNGVLFSPVFRPQVLPAGGFFLPRFFATMGARAAKVIFPQKKNWRG